VLNESALADYAVNCYAGCEHSCIYCYARYTTRFSHPGAPWGSFVDVKINAPQVLAREAARKKVGNVFLSSVCDGWQPAEATYGLTRQCLEILLHHHYPLSILTKSVLAGRDFDLLKKNQHTSFGVTITTLNENLIKFIEPRSSPASERLGLLQEAKRKGLSTYAFLGPLLPHLSDTEASLMPLLKAVKEVGVDYCYIDQLNRRFGLWTALKNLLMQHFPRLLVPYERFMFDEHTRAVYAEKLRAFVYHLARRQRMVGKLKVCF